MVSNPFPPDKKRNMNFDPDGSGFKNLFIDIFLKITSNIILGTFMTRKWNCKFTDEMPLQ